VDGGPPAFAGACSARHDVDGSEYKANGIRLPYRWRNGIDLKRLLFGVALALRQGIRQFASAINEALSKRTECAPLDDHDSDWA
jgi:hypothetical protein